MQLVTVVVFYKREDGPFGRVHNYIISWGKYRANISYVQKSKTDKI